MAGKAELQEYSGGCLYRLMQAKEFGKEHDRKIVLIPSNMMSWRQFENVIPILEKDFHVIAVSTDGYDEKTEFTTAEKSAESIEKYLTDNLDSHIDLVFGESFGTATAGMMFNRQKVKIDSIIMSGPQYMRLGVFTGLIKRIIPGNQYRLTQKIKSGRKSGKMPLMLKLYTQAVDENMLKMFEAMPDNITLKTLQNCTDEALRLYEVIDQFEPDPNAKVSIWHGAKEPNMKKALEKLRRAFPAAEDHSFDGMGHGDIIGHPEVMAAEIKKFMER